MENINNPNFNQEPSTLENNSKKKLIIIITVLIFIVLGAIAYLSFTNQENSVLSKKEQRRQAKLEQKANQENGSDIQSVNGANNGTSSDNSEMVSGLISFTEDYTVTTKKDVTYATVDGISLKIDIYTPNGVSGATPAVMYIHGGGFKGGSKNGVADDSEMLARHGIAVVAVDYRLSGTAKFPAQIYDVNSATRYIKAHASEYNIDPNKIFSLGESAGGVLASLLGVTGTSLEGTVGGNTGYNSDVIGVINISGSYVASIVDTMSGGIKNSISNVVDCSPVPSTACESDYEELSPESYISSNDAPFIILHGDKDGSVPTIQAETLQDKLQASGVPAELHVAPDLAHVGGLLSRYLNEVISFINSNI